MPTADAHMDFERYSRQMALDGISHADQMRLRQSRIIVVGAGGLGCAALPYLTGAGVGHITIIDHDRISINNLHRQILFQNAQEGDSKAKKAAEFCRALNPDIEIISAAEKLTQQNAYDFCSNADLIIDGSDNFETKSLLNKASIECRVPLISASVQQWQGQAGIFAGHAKDAPCYHCLFPELPNEARNCNEAGILGTAAGLTGLYQGHLALLFLLRHERANPGCVISFDFASLRQKTLHMPKDLNCGHCKNDGEEFQKEEDHNMDTNLISMAELSQKPHQIVDVRTDEEIAADPIDNAIHMEIGTLPARYKELPEDTLLAFVCAGNVRSVKAAEFMQLMGRDNVCVLDKFSL